MADALATSAIAANDGSAYLVTWTPLNSTDTEGVRIEAVQYGERTVQVTGTFGTGTLVIQGSNDGTNWATLKDIHGTAISTGAAGIFGVAEIVRYIRPAVTGANGTTDLDITMLVRTENNLRQ
jgi:hypothetical protein